MTIDVFPTMAKLAGLKLTQPVDGVPAGERPPSDVVKLFEKASADASGATLGKPVRYDGSVTLPQMLAGNVDATTAPGDPALKLWRGDPYGTLVGRKVSDLTVGEASPTTVSTAFVGHLHHAGTWRERGLPPSMIWGAADRTATVALALNGTIAGVSPTFDATRTFSMMVPDTLMQRGPNRPVFYEVTGSDAKPVLRPVRVRQVG